MKKNLCKKLHKLKKNLIYIQNTFSRNLKKWINNLIPRLLLIFFSIKLKKHTSLQEILNTLKNNTGRILVKFVFIFLFTLKLL